MSAKVKEKGPVRARERKALTVKSSLSTKIDRDLFEKLDGVCQLWGVPRGSVVERALDFYFRLALTDTEKLPKSWLS